MLKLSKIFKILHFCSKFSPLIYPCAREGNQKSGKVSFFVMS